MVKLSVIIPARNEEEHIQGCLDSLMNQTRKPFEIIVITNNSTDRTEEIVNRYKKRGVKQIVFHGKSSAAIARNTGARSAKGDVLYFLDADVTCSPTLIAEIYTVFSDPEVMHAVTPASAHVHTLMQRCYKAKMFYIHQRRIAEKTVHHGVSIIRRELFEKVGGYPEDIFYFEDRMLWGAVRGYKGGEIKSLVYHNDPGTLKEFIRQSKYWGRGFSTYSFKKLLQDNLSLSIAVNAWFMILILTVIILLLTPDKIKSIEFIVLISLGAVITYGLVRALVYSIYSRMPIESFAWVFILMPIRFFYIGLEYTKNKLKKSP